MLNVFYLEGWCWRSLAVPAERGWGGVKWARSWDLGRKEGDKSTSLLRLSQYNLGGSGGQKPPLQRPGGAGDIGATSTAGEMLRCSQGTWLLLLTPQVHGELLVPTHPYKTQDPHFGGFSVPGARSR